MEIHAVEDDFIEDKQLNIFDMQQKVVDVVLVPEENIILDELFVLIPEADRIEKNKNLIKKYLDERDENFVKSNIEYTIKNAKNFSAMFWMALEKDFGEKDRLAKSVTQKKKEETRKKEEKKKELERKIEIKAEEEKKEKLQKYNSLNVVELEKLQEWARKHAMFKFFKEDLKSNKISEIEALKRIILECWNF